MQPVQQQGYMCQKALFKFHIGIELGMILFIGILQKDLDILNQTLIIQIDIARLCLLLQIIADITDITAAQRHLIDFLNHICQLDCHLLMNTAVYHPSSGFNALFRQKHADLQEQVNFFQLDIIGVQPVLLQQGNQPLFQMLDVLLGQIMIHGLLHIKIVFFLQLQQIQLAHHALTR